MLTIKPNYKLLFFLLILATNCKPNKKKSKGLPLYQFSENILFQGYTNDDLKSANIFYKSESDSIQGGFVFNTKDELSAYGRVHFKSIYDTIHKKDTIFIQINNNTHTISNIEQQYVKVSMGSNKPGFVEFQLDGNTIREGNAVLTK